MPFAEHDKTLLSLVNKTMVVENTLSSNEEVSNDIDHFFEKHAAHADTIRFESPGWTTATKHSPAFQRDDVLHTKERGVHNDLRDIIQKHNGNYHAYTEGGWIDTSDGVRHSLSSTHGTHHSVYTHSIHSL